MTIGQDAHDVDGLSTEISAQEDYIRWLEKHRVDSSDARTALGQMIGALATAKRRPPVPLAS